MREITELSHWFGTGDYVKGGGGNTSVKDETTIWVKPSGITLATITQKDFVAMNHSKLSRLYSMAPPSDPHQRELLVKQIMVEAKTDPQSGRPSVEAPLHDSIKYKFIVHTHPAVVNGMACSNYGAEICSELFPDALWLDYIDPGYSLCMEVRRKVCQYAEAKDKEPTLIILKNHGIFAAADTVEEVRQLYEQVMSTLKGKYLSSKVSLQLKISDRPAKDKQALLFIRENYPEKDIFVSVEGYFDIATGPVSPDHIVYSKSFPFIGQPEKDKLELFRQEYGYLPKIISWDNMIFGIGETEKKAQLALELAKDGALVKQLAEAFGGICYLDEKARLFIENWEAESYRIKQL